MSRRIVHAVLFSLFGTFAIQCAHNMLLAQDADYIHKASGSAIFVYAPNTQPCAERQVGSNLLPSGSGFVMGIRQKGATAENWRGYKFLITAKHVIGNRTSIILRLNRKDTPEFTCYPLQLVRNRDKRNILTPDRPEVDLIAVSIPNIPNTDPTVFEYSMVLDEQQMAKLEVQVGTNVFAVGYLYGYAGKKKEFPGDQIRKGRVAHRRVLVSRECRTEIAGAGLHYRNGKHHGHEWGTRYAPVSSIYNWAGRKVSISTNASIYP